MLFLGSVFGRLLLLCYVLGLVSSVLCQEIGWEEHLRNDLFCVEWDIKNLTLSITCELATLSYASTQSSVNYL